VSVYVSAFWLCVGMGCVSLHICLCGYMPDCVGEVPVAFWCHSQAAPTAKGTLGSGKLFDSKGRKGETLRNGQFAEKTNWENEYPRGSLR